MKLEGKCVKVIDSDITEDTCWSKCYSYVITKDIHVLNNVKLTIQDGARIYLLNGEALYDEWWFFIGYNGGGIIFDAGSKLCASNLLVAAVVLEDGKYVLSNKISYNINNNGVYFFGTEEEEELERDIDIYALDVDKSTMTKDNMKNLSKSDKTKLCRRKMNELKKSMVKENNQSSKFVFKSLTLEYIGGLYLENLDSKEFCGKNITMFNLFTGQNYTQFFNLYNTNICLNNLEILTNKPKIQEYSVSLGLDNSTLTINKSLTAAGGQYFFQNNGFFSQSYVILNKCSKILIEVAYFNYFSEITIEPKGLLPNPNKIPYLVDKCLKEKVVITSTPYY